MALDPQEPVAPARPLGPASTLAPAPAPTPADERWTLAGLASAAFGLATLVVVLATLAAIPIVQFLSLGYLLEAEGRVARTGRLRGALPGLARMTRLGSAAIGTLLVSLPALVLVDFWKDAILIDPTSPAARKLGLWSLATGAFAALDALLAIAHGGRVRDFFRPIRNARWAVGRLREGGVARSAWSQAREVAGELRLGHTFVLGLKGFFAALAWIAVPTAILAIGYKAPPIGLLGAIALALAVIPLPLLQARLAAEGRFRAGFELGAVWAHFRAAPVAALLALIFTLALAVPLYAFKVELIPRDARWLPALVILATVLPTKLAAGKAYARGSRGGRAHGVFRFASAGLALPIALAYVGILFVTPFFGWRGAAGLFEQHAFLLPVAFY